MIIHRNELSLLSKIIPTLAANVAIASNHICKSADEAEINRSCASLCVKVLKDAMSKVPEAEKSKPDFIAKTIREHCESSKLKDHKFCFYIGALPESATSMMVDVTKPLSWSMPPEKVCEKLKAKDAQICELKYDKPLDWKTIDLKKMRVKELKNILNEWGEVCKGCTEKSEYVKKIEELKPKYVKEEL
ncbi:MANF/CDNF-like family protein [Teladorsagia circumcincta]|uniref:Mesencephalic astrocyte-derived neurotrophic factor homolog n=1 Tax=Teladorsagia circumcincta TaxID=45464 RepID=A0A2G9UAM8_TELCI|nr:MANF/CDNF-like family protein [Teladorsagia circumcincta]